MSIIRARDEVQHLKHARDQEQAQQHLFQALDELVQAVAELERRLARLEQLQKP